MKRSLVLLLAIMLLFPVAAPIRADASFAPSMRIAGLDCADLVSGFDRTNHLHMRVVHNGEVTYAKASRRATRYKVLSSYVADYSRLGRTRYDGNLATINSDNRPRYVYFEDGDTTDAEQHLFIENKPFSRRLSGQRLLAAAASYYVYMVNKRGVLNRWTTYESADGPYYWASPHRVRGGMASLRTLVWNGTATIGGRTTDLLWGTTRAGALVRIQVPVASIRRSKLVEVRRQGFAEVTGLSAATCGGRDGLTMLVAVSKSADAARWYTVRGHSSRPSRLVNRGRVAGSDLSWRLHAVS